METVLVAEDDPGLLEVFELWLDGYGEVAVRTAEDGAEAVDRLDDTVDLAVLDRRMPEKTGDEVARTIQSSYSECAVVIVSAFEARDIDDELYDHYLGKPIDREELLNTVDRELT